MRHAVICEAVRTPVGGYGGSLRAHRDRPRRGGGRGLLARTRIDPEVIDDLILEHCYPNSEAPAIGRVVALVAGLPISRRRPQVDRRCGSGLEAVLTAALGVSSAATRGDPDTDRRVAHGWLRRDGRCCPGR